MSAGALTFPVESARIEEASGALITDHRPSQAQWEEPRGIPSVLVGDQERERAFEKSILEIHGYRDLEENWDTYGGRGASEQPVRFSVRLLEELRLQPEISPPSVSPISTGVYIEWRAGDRLLYFEVDEDSLLFVMEEGERHREDGEDPSFDVARALEIVKRLHGVGDMSAEGITQYST